MMGVVPFFFFIMHKAEKKHFLGNVTLLIMSLTTVLFFSEFVLRKFVSFDHAHPSIQHRIPHPVFGWVLEPNASYINRMPEKAVEVRYNAQGWRDDPRVQQNIHGLFRVLVLGDSFMEAYSVSLEEAFHKQLSRYLRENNIETEVINRGVGGYGTLQEYLVFQQDGKGYQPDLVLLGFYVNNDVRNNSIALESAVSSDLLKAKARPFLNSAEPGVWNITSVDFEGTQSRFLQQKNFRKPLLRKLADQSAVLRLLTKAKAKLARYGSNQAKPQTKADESKKHMAQFGIHYCQEPAEYTQAWHVTEKILQRLKRDVEAAGSALIVFTVPALLDVHTGQEHVQNKAPGISALCFEESPGYQRLNNMLVALGIDYVDLLPVFRHAARAQGAELFRKSDQHWNELGHALAAKTVGSFLIEKEKGAAPKKGQVDGKR